MDMPWKTLAHVDGSREYLALLTYLPLRKYRKIPRFLQFLYQIQRQLGRSTGAIGYSLRARVLRREFWTLSVWESEHTLMDFTAKVPHGDVMKSLAPHMGLTKFVRWKITGSAIPPSWDDAARRSSREA